jgi:hypothetical protein
MGTAPPKAGPVEDHPSNISTLSLVPFALLICEKNLNLEMQTDVEDRHSHKVMTIS